MGHTESWLPCHPPGTAPRAAGSLPRRTWNTEQLNKFMKATGDVSLQKVNKGTLMPEPGITAAFYQLHPTGFYFLPRKPLIYRENVLQDSQTFLTTGATSRQINIVDAVQLKSSWNSSLSEFIT